jgi:hypothetical protein
MSRGTFQFETTDEGALYNMAGNVKTLRRLWLDRKLIDGEDLGPGDPGDFDYGAWHVACHLLGAGGVMQSASKQLLWLEVSHDPARDDYYASVTTQAKTGPATCRLDSAEGRSLVAGATLAGFVEGNSVARISARGTNDPPELFNLWRRQDFDQPVGEEADGGKVWEHWCTLRDIRPSARIGTSVLTAFVSLVSVLGDRFVPTVARGRRDYGHPKQLRAMVKAGFVGKQSALWDTQPVAIPPAAEKLFLEAEPAKSLPAAAQLDWSKTPRYYMFQRRIQSWSTTDKVKEDLKDV